MLLELEFFIIYVLFSHFVADFIFQTRWMAKNKSSKLLALNIHIFIYASVLFVMLGVYGFLPFALTAFTFADLLNFVFINATAHLLTDYFTSKWTKKLYLQDKEHAFFTVIGFDQFLHVAALVISFFYIL